MDNRLPTLLKNSILMFLWMDFLWHAYLNRRQFNKVLHTTELPREFRTVMPQPIFRISRNYALAYLEFSLSKSVAFAICSTIFLYGDYVAQIWTYAQTKNPYDNEIVASCIWLFILYSVSALIDFPFDCYRYFIVEKYIGIGITSLNDFLVGHLLGFCIIQILSMLSASVVILIIHYIGRYFFIGIWFVCCILVSIFSSLYSAIGSPTSSSKIDFPETNLKHKIVSLCEELNFPLRKVELLLNTTSMEEHNVVYFYGVTSKNIVISVNIVPIPQLNNALSEEEIMALLIHQLGHWIKRHDLKRFIIIQAMLLLWFFFFIYLFEKKVLYEAFGFQKSQPVLAGIMLSIQYAMLPCNSLISFVLISSFRKFEFEADDFVANAGMKDSLKKGLLGIYVVNFQFPVLDELYSRYNMQQPSLLERIKHLNEYS